jgi:hypothetical protein
MTDMSEVSRARNTTSRRNSKSEPQQQPNEPGALGAAGSGAELARSWFARWSEDPSSVELGGYLGDAAFAGHAELQAFGETLQECLAEHALRTEHPLVEDNITDSLMNLTAYSVFLTDAVAQGGTGHPGPQLRHGQYLAQRVLQAGLERLEQIQATEAVE